MFSKLSALYITFLFVTFVAAAAAPNRQPRNLVDGALEGTELVTDEGIEATKETSDELFEAVEPFLVPV